MPDCRDSIASNITWQLGSSPMDMLLLDPPEAWRGSWPWPGWLKAGRLALFLGESLSWACSCPCSSMLFSDEVSDSEWWPAHISLHSAYLHTFSSETRGDRMLHSTEYTILTRVCGVGGGPGAGQVGRGGGAHGGGAAARGAAEGGVSVMERW